MSEDFANLVSKAEASITSIIAEEHSFVVNFEKAAYKVVENIVALHRAGENEPDAYAAFLKERGVEITNRTINPFHPTTSALVRREARRLYRQRITQYAQVAYVLAERKVKNVADWFNKPEKVGSRVLTGLSKGTAIYKSMPHVIEHNAERRAPSKAADEVTTDTSEVQCHTGESGVADTSNPSGNTGSVDHETKAETAVAVGYIDGNGRFVATRTIIVPEVVAAALRVIDLPAPVPGNDNSLMEKAV